MLLTFSCLMVKCLNNSLVHWIRVPRHVCMCVCVCVCVCGRFGMCLNVWVAVYVSVSEWYCPSPLSPVWVGSLVRSLRSPQSSQSCQPSWTWSTSNGIAFKSISVLCWWALLLSQISPQATSLFISNSSVLSPRTRAVMHTHILNMNTHTHTHTQDTHCTSAH